MIAIKETNFNLPGQQDLYRGKVRDVYHIKRADKDPLLVMVTSDRISAFDVVLPRPIPFKGQVLTQIAAQMLEATSDIAPNWIIDTPDPRVMIGRLCEPFKVEMVIRGYLTGHAAREYKSGNRLLCGVPMPDGMKEHDRFPQPLITPTTKAAEGHDQDISREEIIAQGIVSEADYLELERLTRALYERGTQLAAAQGLILVDTKYEFGKGADGRIYVIDEIHTPDSSRYFYLDGYQDRQDAGEPQKQLSKEFVREWLMSHGFQGKDGQQIPQMTDEFVHSVTDRYVELFEKITGGAFEKSSTNTPESLEAAVVKALSSLTTKAG